MRAEGGREEALDRRLFGDVRRGRQCGTPHLRDATLCLGETFGIDIRDDEGCPFLREAERDRAPKSAGRAGHEGNLVGYPIPCTLRHRPLQTALVASERTASYCPSST